MEPHFKWVLINEVILTVGLEGQVKILSFLFYIYQKFAEWLQGLSVGWISKDALSVK